MASTDTARALYRTARDTSWRLKGMASVFFSLGLWSQAAGGHDIDQYSFLGHTLKDLALGLERDCKAQWEVWEAEDAKAAAPRRTARKPAAKRQRKAANGARAGKGRSAPA